jgi:Rod binding domain-containing protein
MTIVPSIVMPRAVAVPAQARKVAQAGNDARLEKSAQDFTAVALGEMLAPMFDTLDQTGGTFGGGGGEAAFRPMLVQEFAKTIARQGGFGLTEQVAKAMLALQEKRS